MKRIGPALIAIAVFLVCLAFVRTCNAGTPLVVRWIDGTEVRATVEYQISPRLVIIRESALFQSGFESP